MATASAITLNAQFEDRLIPLELIDDPEVPERETMEERYLAELALSIAEVGLIKKLIVKPVGERYEVVAGHRRIIGCRLAKYSPVPCRVMVGDTVDPLAILVHENAHTEDVNPIEEARFYLRLLNERCENDVDALCIMVRRKREFVEDRLNLLRGWPEVVDTLQLKRISMAVARELNKVSDRGRMLIMLDNARTMGATARQVAEWRKNADAMGPVQMPAIDGDMNGAAAALPSSGFQPECLFCGDSEEPHLMKLVYLHGPCERIVMRMLQRVPASEQRRES
jgi:ParB/RepB/Spo0J family partition protein